MQLTTPTRSIVSRLLGSGLALSLVFLAGCQPVAEGDALATGQVFLIRPSGDSLRLGSVRVQLFDAETMSRHLVERGRSLALQQEELRARVAALEAEVDQALEDRDQADAAYREREAEIRISLGAYVEQQEARKATLQQGIESNRAFIDSVDSLPPPPDGVPSREENLAYEERRQKWLSMNRAERMNWGVVLSSLNADLEAEIRTLAAEREEKVFALSDELQALDLRIAEGDAAVRAAVAALAGTRQRLADFPQYGDYLSELPSPIEEGRTDADGEFAFTLRLDRSYVLFADAERVMGGETQYFTWLVRVNAGGGRPVRLVLSNHNLLGAEGAERVITLPGHLAPSET